MTNREFLTAIANSEILPAELKAEAAARIERINNVNEARKNKPSKTATENAPILSQILSEILTPESKTASTVAAEAGISVQKASALLRQLVAEGKAAVAEVKIPKKGTQKAYAAVVTDAE
jgi:predicted transcriptional regulator